VKNVQPCIKYHRKVNVIDGIDTAIVTASVGMGIGGADLLCIISTSLTCGLLGVAGKFISRRLNIKAKKHDEIRVLCDSKLNAITDYVSTALIEGKISDHEFRLVSEVSKYHEMKDEIRIQRGRDEVRENFIKSWSHNNIRLSLRFHG